MLFSDLAHKVVKNISMNMTLLRDGESVKVSLKALAVSSVTNGLLLLVSLLIFSLLRNKFPRVYTPRKLLYGLDFSFGKLPSSLFGWLMPMFKLKDEEILEHLGLDALMFLRFIRLCFTFSVIILPYGLLVALPVNYYGGVSDTDDSVEGLDRMTMGNVKPLSGKLWVHFIGVWVYTFVILFLLYREYVAYQRYRQKSLSNGDRYPHRYLVMLHDLPDKLHDQERMKEYVEERFPGQTLGVYVLEEDKQWQKLTDQYKKAQRNLAAAKADYYKSGKRPQHCPKLFGLKGSKVDSITFYEEEIKNLKAELEEERAKPHKALNHSFVAYKSLREAAIAGNGLAWDYYPDQLQPRICPEKTDMVWENLKRDRRLRFLVSFVMNTVVQFLMIFFWSIPIGVASTMVSFKELEQKIPFFKELEKLGPIVTGFISGFLSTVVVVLFFALLPMILAFLAYIKGIQTHSEIHNDVLEKLFVFKVLNQFVLYILGSSMMMKLTEILDTPSEIPTAMATEMPNAANFFINFIMLKATTIFGFELLRIPPLIIINIRRKFFVKSSLDDKDAWEPPEMWFSEQYAEVLLIFLIAISYSVLAPLVIPFALVYFGFGYVTWMNQLMFVYVPKWEGDGQMWPIVFHRMMVTIVVFVLFMIGLFGLKRYATIATLHLPLLVICIVFWYHVNDRFAKPSAALTFTSCTEIRDLSPDLIEDDITLPEWTAKDVLFLADGDNVVIPIENTFGQYKRNQNIPEFPSDYTNYDEIIPVNAQNEDEELLLPERK